MRYVTFSETEHTEYKYCFLVNKLDRELIRRHYITPYGLDPIECVALELYKDPTKKKTSAADLKEYKITELDPALEGIKPTYLIIGDSAYFKEYSVVAKAEATLGYVAKSKCGKYELSYIPDYRTVMYNPDTVNAKIAQTMNAINAHSGQTYQPPGTDILKDAKYPKTVEEITQALQDLLDLDCDLTCDIEAFGLKHYNAGIGTISFSIDKHSAVAFPVDYVEIPKNEDGHYGKEVRNEELREVLRQFFTAFHESGRSMKYHSITYDAYVLIYQLFMKDLLDTEGLLKGMEILLTNWDCTKLIRYLATNTCAGNKLGLKEAAQEYAGNYAKDDIKDIRLIPLDELLTYNMVDTISTWYTYEENWPVVVSDKQVSVYQDIFKPAVLDIVQMQLTGMPVNMKRVKEVEQILIADEADAIRRIQQTSGMNEFIYQMKEKIAAQKNAKWVKKRCTWEDVEYEFNPNSGQQVQYLLYEFYNLPVIEKTDSGAPATDGDTLKKLKNHTKVEKVIELLKALEDYAKVAKIISSFIPALLGSQEGPDGWHYLFGNFNLGGTISGRLSSSEPNLQNLPAGGKYGKLIKSCFEAPPGWIFAGLDFASLEDRISALTTRDPNKLKVYLEGFDGHSLRAYGYFGEQMPDIDPSSAASINSIAELYPDFRQKSKAPTFALTYQGTWATLVGNCGFTVALAKDIEAKYHEMYKVSDEWVQKQLKQATKDGYVTIAFGLRLRTPLLKQSFLGSKATPSIVAAEGRSAGNALGQSWCLLNNRAASEFMGKVRKSEHRLDIRPTSHIHDAQYYLIRDTVKAVSYANEHLVIAVKWQDDPLIYHPEVPLGGELSLFYPTWAEEITLPNDVFGDDLLEIVDTALVKRAEKQSKK